MARRVPKRTKVLSAERGWEQGDVGLCHRLHGDTMGPWLHSGFPMPPHLGRGGISKHWGGGASYVH